MSLLEWFIMKRMDASTKRLEKVVLYPNRSVEFLTLRLGDTSIEREVFSDGSKGNIRIDTQEAQDILGAYMMYVRYIFADGKLVLDPGYRDNDNQDASLFRRLLLVLKLLLNISEAPVLDEEEDVEDSYIPVA
jgi:hypothetical protein